jgi:cell division protein ZapB
MENELNTLEERIREAVELCKRLRAENIDMRQRVAQLESDNRRLREKVTDAVGRIDALVAKIPENAP